MTENAYKEINEILSGWQRNYAASVVGTVLGTGVPHHDAEDVTQDVWMKALRHLMDAKPGPPCPERWLRSIAANAANDYHRRQRGEIRRRKCLGESCKVRTDSDPHTESERVAKELRCKKIADAMMSAVESLDPELRDVIEGRFVEGRSLVEIAAWLRVHVNTVTKREKRALELLLRRKLEDCGVATLS